MIPWRRDRLPTPVFLGSPSGSTGQDSTCNVGDLGSISGLERSPGGGHDNPLQYSCLENPMDRGAWWDRDHRVAKSWTWLTKLTVCFILCEFYHSKQHLKKHIYVLRGIWKFFFPHWEKNRRQTVDGLQRIPVLMLLIPLSTSLSSPLLNNVLYLMMSLLMEDSELHSWSEKPSQLFNQHSSTWP